MSSSTRTYGVISDEDLQSAWAFSGRGEGSMLFDLFGGRPSHKIREAAEGSWERQIPKYARKDFDHVRESFVSGIVVGYCQRYTAITGADVDELVASCS